MMLRICCAPVLIGVRMRQVDAVHRDAPLDVVGALR
jgi:hypothetical protein